MSRNDHRGLEPLLATLYQASGDPTLWGGAVDDLSDALGGAALVMGLHRGGRLAFGVTNRLDPEKDTLLRAEYCCPTRNPLFAAMPRLPVLEPVERGALISESDYLASGLFNDVFRDQGFEHAAVSCLAREQGVMISCGVLKRRGIEFDADHMRLYQALLPHLRRALELTVRFFEVDLARRRAEAAADTGAEGLLIVDVQRRILFMNSSAKEILDNGAVLRCRNGSLEVTATSEKGRLAQLVQEAAKGKGYHGGSMRLGRHGASPLAAVIIPLPPDTQSYIGGAGSTVLITLIDLTPRRALPAVHIARLFGLTKTEAEVALAVMDGLSAEEIASQRRVAVSAVKRYQASIAAKTGTRCQADLARLLGRAPRSMP